MSKLFIDTSFIIPLFKKMDSNKSIVLNNKDLLVDNDCYISNGVLNEVVTVVMMRTKSFSLTKLAYNFLIDNFTVLNELSIEMFNNKVFSVFAKYNQDTFKLSFVDCASVVIVDHFDLDGVVSLDKDFKLFDEISLYELKNI